MPRYRLRYQSSHLEMPAGEFVIGRGSECHLSIDDASVSRRHACLRVEPTGVTVEDLGSRNGVSVNDLRIAGRHRLQHLDRLTIGNQELLFIDADGRQRQAPTALMHRCDACGAMNTPSSTTCEICGHELPAQGRAPIEPQTLELRFGAPGEGVDKSEEAFRLIAGIAEKALAMKRFEKAEQILAPHLDMMLFRAHRGERYAPELIESALGFALRLAEERSSRRWLQFVFILHTHAKTLMDAATIERLHEIVRKVRYDDGRPLQDYLAALASLEETFTPADRFLVKRLEALYRVISA